MSNYKKSNSSSDQDKHVIEYTSGQLILAICLGLLVALVCFVLGMFVGPPIHPEVASNRVSRTGGAANAPGPTPSNPFQKATGKGEKEGRQTLPSPSVLSTVKAPPVTHATGSTDTASGAGPRTVELPPLEPSAAKGTASSPLTKNTGSESSKPTPSAAELPTTEHRASHEEAPATKMAQTQTGNNVTLKNSHPAPPELASAAPVKAADTPGAAPYSIQLAAFASNERAKAENYKYRLEKYAQLKPELVKSHDGKNIRVLVGAYADYASALKARNTLARRAEFRNCFVKKHERP